MSRLASPAQLRASFVRWAAFSVPAVLLLGFASGRLGGSAGDPWFVALTKPAMFPPPAAFGIVWPVLYVLMGFALAIVCSAWGARHRRAAIALFVVQLVVNLAWSPAFFGLHRISAALAIIVVLDVLVIATVVLFSKVRRMAALMLLPYLAWILFATVLNWQFLLLNPSADGAEGPGSVQRIEL